MFQNNSNNDTGIEFVIYGETFPFVTISLYRKKTIFNQAFIIYADCSGQEADELLLWFELPIDVKDEMGQNIFLILGQLHLQVMKNQNSLEAST